MGDGRGLENEGGREGGREGGLGDTVRWLMEGGEGGEKRQAEKRGDREDGERGREGRVSNQGLGCGIELRWGK